MITTAHAAYGSLGGFINCRVQQRCSKVTIHREALVEYKEGTFMLCIYFADRRYVVDGPRGQQKREDALGHMQSGIKVATAATFSPFHKCSPGHSHFFNLYSEASVRALSMML